MRPAVQLPAALLAVVAMAHLCRLILGIPVTVADRLIPMWVSGVAFVVAGGASVMLWRSGRKR
jgi:hypothetical protein